MKLKTMIPVALTAICISSGPEAALVARLDGAAYYDDVLNITWLADANYAATIGYSPYASPGSPGALYSREANLFVSNLNIAGITGWRLPTAIPVDGTTKFNFDFTNNGSTDFGTGQTGEGWRTSDGTPASEMGYMFYVTLKNLGLCASGGGGSSSSCVPQSGFGLVNSGPFAFPDSSYGRFYRTSVSLDGENTRIPVYDSTEMFFDFDVGKSVLNSPGAIAFVWPVHDGDVGANPVPLPATLFLLAPALAGLRVMRRRAS